MPWQRQPGLARCRWDPQSVSPSPGLCRVLREGDNACKPFSNAEFIRGLCLQLLT